MPDVTTITADRIELLGKLDGSVDVGFSYTRSSRIAQLNINTNTVFRRPAFEARLTASGTATQNGDGRLERRPGYCPGVVQPVSQRAHVRRGRRELREQRKPRPALALARGVHRGPAACHSNRAQLAIGAGLAVNDERNIGADPTQNLEGVVTFRQSYYRTIIKNERRLAFQYFPSLTNWGRQRIQLDASAKREIWKDVFCR